MISDLHLNCFHTCKLDGGKDFIISRVPFPSDSQQKQWLGQGFYLWTDSDFFAHEWGRDHYQSSYAINQFEVRVPRDLFWDLVGNVQHQIEFVNFKDQFYCLLDEIVERATPAKRQQTQQQIQRLKQQEIKVSTLFWVLRHLRKLAYKVVKASDIKSKKTESIEFIGGKGGECIFLPTRQQIVVYPESKYMIHHIDWVHP
ncbi:hypothetical protein [Acinetobacter pittii]|uniref:hypothetical protein n=1 Tax=Acinetobacter pittii TaxID=48296 RepID=UPI00034CB89A|nr:hypothetical protein [Acinetobacter pittii]